LALKKRKTVNLDDDETLIALSKIQSTCIKVKEIHPLSTGIMPQEIFNLSDPNGSKKLLISKLGTSYN
jgi:hypothetical protein